MATGSVLGEAVGGRKRKMYEKMTWVSFRDSKGRRHRFWARR
jgi:hypothetical protein